MAVFKGLKEGAVIDLVAPASRCSSDQLSKGIDVLKEWGYNPRVPKMVFSQHPYLSNSDEFRYQTLKSAILSKDSDVIWAIRGGYGCARLINDLKRLKPKKKKMYIGYSDNSWLHHIFYELWGWESLHSSLISELGGTSLSQKSRLELKKYLSNPTDLIYKGLIPLNALALKKKVIKGRVSGGNLKVLQTTLGTEFSFNTKNKIVFFEDVGERGYAVDRMLIHLKDSKVFSGVRAVIFGEFLAGDEPDGKNHIRRAINEFAQSVNFPVLKGLKSGHGANNYPIPVYKNGVLQLGSKPELVILNK